MGAAHSIAKLGLSLVFEHIWIEAHSSAISHTVNAELCNYYYGYLKKTYMEFNFRIISQYSKKDILTQI